MIKAAELKEEARNGHNVQYQNGIWVADGAMLDDDVSLGMNVFIGSNTVIRGQTVLNDGVVIGPLCCFEEEVTVGKLTRIQSCCYITKLTRIGENVFIGPCLVTANEWRISSHGRRIPQKLEGPIIHDCARVGAGCLIMPGIKIGRNALLGAGSIATRNIEEGEIWFGYKNAAIQKGRVPVDELIENGS